MWIYVVNIALIIYWWFIYTLVNSKKIKTQLHPGPQTIHIGPSKTGTIGNKIILLLPFLQVYLILSLKNYSVGTDTISYLEGFTAILHITWQDILNFQIHNLVFNFERGFIALSKCITMLTKDFTVYSAIVYVIMVVPLYTFIKKHSAMPFLSLILFIAFGFLNFYFSGMRQAIAISIVLLSYDCIVKRKMWRFFLLITIAALFHKSAIFFFPAYFLMNVTITPLIGMFYLISLVVTYVFRIHILGFLTQYMYEGLQIEDTGAYTLLLIVLMTFVLGMFSYKKVTAMNSNNKLIYNLIAVAVGLMIFNTVSNIGLRAANYYYIFMILFIPNILISLKNELIRRVAITVVVVFTLAYYFQIGVKSLNGIPYKFFWQ